MKLNELISQIFSGYLNLISRVFWPATSKRDVEYYCILKFDFTISRVFLKLFISSSAKKRHERGRRDEEMEQDESRDIDLRRNTPKSPEQQRKRSNDLRSKISSTVVKIKTEKAEDERKKRAEDRRLR